jgi:hypothetical protein
MAATWRGMQQFIHCSVRCAGFADACPGGERSLLSKKNRLPALCTSYLRGTANAVAMAIFRLSRLAGLVSRATIGS